MRVVVLCLLLLSCGSEMAEKHTPNPWHMIPFTCRYLGFELKQLEGCQIACPKSTLEANDITTFTAALHCSHPNYSLLSCQIE